MLYLEISLQASVIMASTTCQRCAPPLPQTSHPPHTQHPHGGSCCGAVCGTVATAICLACACVCHAILTFKCFIIPTHTHWHTLWHIHFITIHYFVHLPGNKLSGSSSCTTSSFTFVRLFTCDFFVAPDINHVPLSSHPPPPLRILLIVFIQLFPYFLFLFSRLSCSSIASNNNSNSNKYVECQRTCSPNCRHLQSIGVSNIYYYNIYHRYYISDIESVEYETHLSIERDCSYAALCFIVVVIHV